MYILQSKPLTKTVYLLSQQENFLKFNLFSHDIEFSRKPEWENFINIGDILTDDHLTNMRYWMGNIHYFEPNKYIVGEACFIIGSRNTYHPVKEYIEKEKWDRIQRLDEWLIKSIGCDNNLYTRLAGKKFLIACVNRVYNPGCKFDHMIILEGEQGIGKSTFVEELAGHWYLDTSFENKDKDLVDAMREALIVEVSELSGMNKKELEWIKSFIVRKVDKIRLPYAARTKPFKRSCVFMGTYNPSGNNMYFRDDTGNRRFWPVECRKINIEWLKENKQQLWAEALECYKKTEPYYIFEPEAIEIMKNMHGERELESPTHTKIKEWIKSRTEEVTMDDIIEKCLGIKTEGKRPKDLLSTATTIGIIMKKLGWRKGTNENRHKYYPLDNNLFSKQSQADPTKTQEIWNE